MLTALRELARQERIVTSGSSGRNRAYVWRCLGGTVNARAAFSVSPLPLPSLHSRRAGRTRFRLLGQRAPVRRCGAGEFQRHRCLVCLGPQNPHHSGLAPHHPRRRSGPLWKIYVYSQRRPDFRERYPSPSLQQEAATAQADALVEKTCGTGAARVECVAHTTDWTDFANLAPDRRSRERPHWD